MPQVVLTPWQVAAIYSPFKHFTMWAGIGAGKTMAGSHFAIWHLINMPEHTGFIGANTHDQMSQATLREMFYWLDAYGLEYVIDRIPPRDWTTKRKFKSYKNVLTVRNPRNGKLGYAFTRVLSDPDALRGIEFSWYWIDEARDTPEGTFPILLGRMRESDYIRGLITTTTNGEDWVFQRFIKGARKNDTLYGSMHVKSIKTIEIGLHSKDWYESMLRSFSPLYAAQELDAEHVNVAGGKAYYAATKQNEREVAPWGAKRPNRDYPLIIGCDFNFSPAPCIWMVGQIGPNLYDSKGRYFGNMIHWFAEIREVEMSSSGMAMILLQRFPGFYYRIYGDCSGGVGTTSNAGVTDYDLISIVLNDAEAGFSIDYFQSDEAQNPSVKMRVENMNSMFCNAMGEVRQTYSPSQCPSFKDDCKMVGWGKTTNSGRGKLSGGGDVNRTHATDGAGYAVMKIFPPASRFSLTPSVPSKIRGEYGLLEER